MQANSQRHNFPVSTDLFESENCEKEREKITKN